MGQTALTVFREIAETDFDDVADALIEMQAHYRVHCPTRGSIIDGLKSRPVGSRILLACENDGIAGFACFSAIYPGPGLTSGFFLKELYVRQDRRKAGLGKRLMARLAAMARQEGHDRIDWTVDADDLRLQQFYEMLGGRALPKKQFFRLAGTKLTELAGM
ncbi:GNAT family N-acetyltransferase [Bradyrhizobium sp. CCGUVB1N3]|uniref:GNAT family N-acetyltransferase n=1 Tax=Bradyrhizobium sp. CCGUVB1N3 TaxID=2949629 RepID=UPI0020B2AADC|nr:GNAT family N-acetyltransferase [Bradyrhizobium sp. CCGUVB1N3]MCP3469128.1 GNAT family N-acetyltransferase [Bradyrhizobium sp. CCGUVB1N3]